MNAATNRTRNPTKWVTKAVPSAAGIKIMKIPPARGQRQKRAFKAGLAVLADEGSL